MPGLKRAGRSVVTAAAVSALALACGCGGGGAGVSRGGMLTAAAEPGARWPAEVIERGVRPAADRLDVVAGVRAVIPVVIGPAFDHRTKIVLKLDDGRVPLTGLERIEIAPQPAQGSWLTPPGRWRVLLSDEDPAPGAAWMWLLWAELPADGFGQGIWVNGRRWELNWLPSPEMLSAQHPELAWPIPVKPEARASTTFQRLIEPERLSPVRRWRWRLATDGLRAVAGGRATIFDPTTSASAFTEPVLEAISAELEAKWAVGLGRLRLTHADLARRLAARLAMVVEFGDVLGRRDGTPVHAPAWPMEQRELDALLADLVSPSPSAAQRARRAENWLADQPAAAGWVVDDARAGDAVSGGSTATLAVANLMDYSTLGWTSAQRAAGAPAMTPVGSGTARAFSVTDDQPAAASTDAEATRRYVLHAGSWSSTQTVSIRKLRVVPPGLTIGPLSPDWSMPAWLGSPTADDAPDKSWATAALLYKGGASTPTAARGKDVRSSGWMLYVECRRLETPEWPSGPASGVAPAAGSPAAPGSEFIRVWLGPTGRARLIVRASPDPGESNSPGVAVSREPGVWTARFEIPESCIEPDGTLRLGLERGDARGVHSAWPRPMLPWQPEPGRLAIDTRAWSGLTADDQ